MTPRPKATKSPIDLRGTPPRARSRWLAPLALSRWFAPLALGAVGLLGTLDAVAQDLPAPEGEDARILGFSIPNTRAAQARRLRATQHLAAGRWNEAIEDLQALIDTHGAELVPVSETAREGHEVHRGASGWAAAEILLLPPEALELYRRRFEARARAALDRARGASERQAIVEVAQRWPGTESATAAWWSVGDLEFELGNLEQARHGWARALELRLGAALGELVRIDADLPADWAACLAELEALEAALGPGEARRAGLALATLSEENPLAEASRLRRTPHGSLRLAGPGEGAHGPPGPDASTWPRPFSIPPEHPFAPGNSGNLFPVRVGDLVFVSNSLQLFAINAYSGSLRWASDKPPGWERLFDSKDRDESEEQYFAGISHQDTMIAPAASERVVVAALQVPISDLHNATFRNIAITTIIPDRRLYAFDAESGRELWNHHPPPLWDGESGSFTDRTSVAGPPVVSASRVIVPVHRMYGRIEFYVACYDLVTGEPLWTTQLVSGQRELNMFARAEEEFSAPPVRIEGDRVVVLTQLGAVAVLDLFSGSILWETLYEQIPPPSRNSFSAAKLKNHWRNAAPVVADGVIVVTPFDSRKLIGLDLESGETLWTIDHHTIEQHAGSRRGDVDLLIGADEHTVFLGGWPVMALRSGGGLSREAPMDLAWCYPSGEAESDESTSARALLLADRVIIPTTTERIAVDRYGGSRLHKAVPWKGGRSGNLLVEDGTLYTLTSQHLDGYFEWDMLLERGRRAYEEAGGDLDSATYLASLIVERSRTELEAGRTAGARDWLVEAEGLLSPFAGTPSPPEAVAREMHTLLRTRGRVFIDLADSASAREALRRARDFAPDLASLCDTLIEEYLFVRDVDRRAQLEILDVMQRRCASRKLATSATWDAERHPYGWRLDPRVLDADERAFGENAPADMWAQLERAGLAAESRDVRGELAALHYLLDRWPLEAVPATADEQEPLHDFAGRRIGALIEQYGREAYAPFEREAAALLAEARESRDRRLLVIVSELYPHSLAGREANDDRLDWATEAGEVEEVARIALSEVPEGWSPARGGQRQVQLMLHLGAVLESAGNHWFAGALYRALASAAPTTRSDAPRHGRRTLAELAASLPPEAELGPAPPALFSPDLARDLVKRGGHRFLGEIPPLSGGGEQAGRVLAFVRQMGRRDSDMSLVAYSEKTLELGTPRPLWNYDVPAQDLPRGWGGRLAFVPGALIASTDAGLYTLGREDGSRTWELDWEAPEGGEIESIVAGEGVVLVTVRTRNTYARLHAIDWVGGHELWSAEFDDGRYDREPLLGQGRVALLPRRSMQRGRILDLFTGRVTADFELPVKIGTASRDTSWIEDDLLIVPWFINGRFQDRNRIVAIDLEDGSERWNADLGSVAGGRRELRSIVQCGGRTYLALNPGVGAPADGVHAIFVELDTRLGAMARVGSYEQRGDLRLIGIRGERRVELARPVVHILSHADGGGPISLEAFDLERRSLLWTRGLGMTRDELYSTALRLPAESEDAVAFVFSVRGEPKFGAPLSTLRIHDKYTGGLLRELTLDDELGNSIDIELHGLGRSLILAGDDMLEVLR